jgi:site-specific DNA-methyltransferase (adenine-specific)
MVRPLLEPGSDIFIRFNEAISIYRKIKAKNETCFNQLISSRKPFGITTSVKPRSTKKQDDLKIYSFPNDGYINPSLVLQNESWINEHKVFISYAYGERGPFPYLIIGKPFYGEPGSCCSETYLLIGPFISKEKCERIIDYMKTKIFRFLVLLRKNTQHATSKVYSFVPMQDFEETWSDEKLYEKYGFTHEESAFIDIMIRPMDLS